MASVQDSIECPQCGGRAILEFQTRTFEEQISCPRCGYRESTRPVIDRQKQRGDPQHRPWYKRRKDGEWIYRTTKRVGLGAYFLAQKNGVSVLGVVNRKLTTKMVANFKRDMAKREMNARCSFLTRWNPRRKRVEEVVGNIPSDFP